MIGMTAAHTPDGLRSDSGAVGAAASGEDRADAVRLLEMEFGELFTHVRRMYAEMANRLSPGMLPGAYKVFTTIARRGETTLSSLAELLHADKGQISRTVRELEELRLVQRAPDPADGRSSLLTATESGLERWNAARAPHENSLLTALETWQIDDIRELTRLLRALSTSASPRG